MIFFLTILIHLQKGQKRTELTVLFWAGFAPITQVSLDLTKGVVKRSIEMPGLREDNFIHTLHSLAKQYPEYKPILKFLIKELQEGTRAQVLSKLESLKNEHW